MKKTAFKAGLMVTPHSLQIKALCRAINFLVPKAKSPFVQGVILKINIHDLEHQWFIEQTQQEFIPSKSNFEDVEIRAGFNVVMECRKKANIAKMLDTGEILILGEEKYRNASTETLSSISQEEIDGILKHFLVFFKLSKKHNKNKPKIDPLLDIHTVCLDDVRSEEQINFIRDEAIRLENLNLDMAINLMSIAHQARPNGPFIMQKLEEYRVRKTKS